LIPGKHLDPANAAFEVFFRAIQLRNRRLGLAKDFYNDPSWDQLYDCALTWFVAKGPKAVSNCAAAIEWFGFGHRILNPEEAKPGDCIDLTFATPDLLPAKRGGKTRKIRRQKNMPEEKASSWLISQNTQQTSHPGAPGQQRIGYFLSK